MRNSFILLAIILFSVPVFAQNITYNDANAEVRSVGSFHGISMASGIDLYLTQGNEEGVAVSASKTEYRDKIKTVVENGVLKIYYDEVSWLSTGWGNRKLKVYVSAKDLDMLRASGGADILINGTLTVSNLKVGLSGGGDFKGAVNVAGSLSFNQSGGSDVNVSGRAANLEIESSGGSDFNGFDLVAETCNASCSGGSDIHVTVNKELSAAANGGSDIRYRGNAAIKKSSTSGGSSVSKRN